MAGVVRAAAAAPDDGFAATVIPVDSSEKLSAFAAENDLGKTMFAGVAMALAAFAGVDSPPADQLFLHQ